MKEIEPLFSEKSEFGRRTFAGYCLPYGSVREHTPLLFSYSGSGALAPESSAIVCYRFFGSSVFSDIPEGLERWNFSDELSVAAENLAADEKSFDFQPFFAKKTRKPETGCFFNIIKENNA
ncbi:hypothetical protein CSA37_06050 [Candidatus Fermentibacteria bacterium]|nr:MAG: hypothetical protein CSA37_06050 [Candidatus Fermentibacteria bacterium]